jgi:hypothetical protein
MSPRFDTFPNVEGLCGVVLRGTLSCGVYSSIPKKDPDFPLITVKRIGGVPAVRERLDAANIQIDSWGTSKKDALDNARDARLALLGMAGQTYTTPIAGFVSDVRDSLGLTWQPDTETGRDRYIFSVYVYAHS